MVRFVLRLRQVHLLPFISLFSLFVALNEAAIIIFEFSFHHNVCLFEAGLAAIRKAFVSR